MKNRIVICCICMSCMVLLAGCWDVKLLRDSNFILGAAFDRQSDDTLTGTFSTPIAQTYPSSSIITTVEGNSIRELTLNANDKIAENLEISKLNVILFHEEMLSDEDGIYPYLDIFIREANNPLSPYVVVTKENAGSFLLNKIPGEGIPSSYYKNLIRAEVDKGNYTDMNVLKASRLFKEEESDIVLPYLKQSKDKTPEAAGLALFDDGRFTGTLSKEEATLFNILDGHKSKFQPELVRKIKGKHDGDDGNHMSFNVLDSKKRMDLQIKNGQTKGKIDLHLEVQVFESPKMDVNENIDYLEKQLSKTLTENANGIIKRLQNANCDGLALGRNLHSFHYKQFTKLDWKHGDYQKADIKANVTVKIEKHGLID